MTGLIHDYLSGHAQGTPAREAARFLDDALTFAELDARSNQLAHTLLEAGVQPGDRVGIFMGKSIHTPVAIYGILKAGAAYVPLDPASGAQRLAGLMDSAGIRVLISGRDKRRTLGSLATQHTPPQVLIGIDNPALADTCIGWPEIARRPARAPAVPVDTDDLAYIIYTSGSTGTPKGMMHTHASCLAFARWAVGEYGLTADDRLSNHAPLHFDLSILDYFAGVVAGATTVIIPEDYARLPASYAQLVNDAQISVLYTVPYALIQLLLRGAIERFEFAALRWVIFGGEPFAPSHLTELMARWPHARFDNIYGPAEVNGVTHYTVPADHPRDQPVPIGPVATGADGLILDEHGAPVPAGEHGELVIASPTMMRGYWAQPELTARAIVERTTTGGGTRRYYRTGDIVRRDDAGNLHFLGRADRQVKVRGYRVELDDVELALAAHPAVEEGAAYALTDPEGETHICAQATLRDGEALDASALTTYVKQRLPVYAAPSKLDITKQFPRTTSGKVDRRRLASEASERYGWT